MNYHEPLFDDRAWSEHSMSSELPELESGQVVWLRCHFDMPPNDECSVWWLEMDQAWPEDAQVWVNYEQLPLPMTENPAKWEITYAIAMDDNVVTLQFTTLPRADFWQQIQVVPYPCH